MVKEINVMKIRDIYKLVERLERVNVISVKYVYVLKFNGDGVFADKKSRIVAKEYLQVQKVNFKEIYTATMYLKSFWLLLAIIASLELYLW